MLTQSENERLTRVGPGTPMGDLLRRYWQPIAPAAVLEENPVRRVRILGEDLVLYRDRSGGLGLVGPRCAHRLVDLRFGIPEDHGLRCPYHGWCYDDAGRCIETPLESSHSRLKDRIRIPAYPVEELGGLVFAYLGPEPAPLLPRWDFLVWPNMLRQIGITVIPCNWLQCHENSVDPMHNRYLHGNFFKYSLERKDALEERVGDATRSHRAFSSMRQTEGADGIVFERDRYGLRKGVRYSQKRGAAKDEIHWFPYNVFPCYSRGSGRVRTQVNMRIPMDDTRTYHINYVLYGVPGVEAPLQKVIPWFEAPLFDEKGEPIVDYVLGQDMTAWWAQGDIVDRTQEHLAGTDVAILEFRRLISDQLDLVAAGRDPINVFRDPSEVGDCIELSPRIGQSATGPGVSTSRNLFHKGSYRDEVDRYGPVIEEAKELMREAEELAKSKEQRDSERVEMVRD